MAKKINIKKFFTNTKSNEVLVSFYKNYEVDDVPFVPETTSPKDRTSTLFEFYKNIDDTEKKQKIMLDITLISSMCTIDAVKILENVFKDSGTVELVMSESIHDIAISYFLSDIEKFLEGKKVYDVYTKSGWQRYPAENKKVKDIDEVNKNLKETFKSILNSDNTNTDNEKNNVLVSTALFDDMYITTISYEDTPSSEESFDEYKNNVTQKIKKNIKEINLVYMPKHGEVLIKAKGKKEILYEYTETYMRNMTGESIENKVIGYDISKFLDINNEGNVNSPLGNHTGVRSFHMKSIELANNNLKQKIKLSFPTLSEKPGCVQMWEMIGELNLKDKIDTFQIMKINILFSLFDENNTDSKINVNLALSETTSNLNIINKRHRLVDEMLKAANVNIGFVDISTEKE